LPGIAGFILSVGMAVDANVLIFERVKEELRSGNTLIRSIDTGFSLAFSSILDGHITGLISCVALFFLGTGSSTTIPLVLAIVMSVMAMTAVGAVVGRTSGRGVLKGAVRQLIVGVGAALVTFVIGRIVGAATGLHGLG
jgi:preprotein translocase subunit SecD